MIDTRLGLYSAGYINFLRDKIQKLEEFNKELEEANKQGNILNQKYLKRIDDLEEESQRLKDHVNSKEYHNQNLIEHWQNSYNELLDKFDTELANKDKEIEKLNMELHQRINTAVSDYQNWLGQEKDKNNNLRQIRDKLYKEIKELKMEVYDCNKQISRDENNINNLEKNIEKINEENKKLKETIDSLTSDKPHKEWDHEIIWLEEENKKLHDKICEFFKDNSVESFCQSGEIIDSLREETKELEEQLEELRVENRCIKQENLNLKMELSSEQSVAIIISRHKYVEVIHGLYKWNKDVDAEMDNLRAKGIKCYYQRMFVQ